MEQQITGKEMSDHDAVITLVANVNSLKESQDTFHKEMKDSFKDLKDNYAGRISCIENKIDKLSSWKNWLIGAYTIGGAVVVFMGIALFNHLTQK
jgi:hypothetical protein